jgi:hypothetical protein
VDGVVAGGGALEVCAGGEQRWQGGAEGGSGVVRGRRSRLESEGLVCDF